MCECVLMTASETVSKTRCNGGAIALTFGFGVLLGGVAGILIAIGSYFVSELTRNNAIASPSLLMSVMFSATGGTFFGFVAAIGAAVALLVADFRLKRSRLVQALIAGIGATLPCIGLLVYMEQLGTTVDYAGSIWIFLLVFASAYGLMAIRAGKHKVAVPPAVHGAHA